MTNPTPISTASSSDDLRLDTIDLHNLAYKLRDEGKIAEGLLVLKARDEILNHRLRQPVAGDVVERAAAAGICDFLASIYEGPDMNDATSMLLEAKRQILELPKLIGGGK